MAVAGTRGSAWLAGRRGVVLAAVLVAAAGLFELTYAQDPNWRQLYPYIRDAATFTPPPTSTFAASSPPSAPPPTFDYIVVGGGAVGCPLAATLSKGFSVLLLERGGVPYDQPLPPPMPPLPIHRAFSLSKGVSMLLLERGGVPYDQHEGGCILILFEGRLCPWLPRLPCIPLLTPPHPPLFILPPSLLQPSVYRREAFPYVLSTRASVPFRSEDGVWNRRGIVLGGGSSVNAGFYSRASADFVQAAGWNPVRVRQAFEWVEERLAFVPQLQPGGRASADFVQAAGWDPVRVRQAFEWVEERIAFVPQQEPGGWQQAFRDGMLEAGLGPWRGLTPEHVIGTKLANSIFDSNGTRRTAADLLKAGDPARLKVLIYATVQRILLDVSSGAVFTGNTNRSHIARLNPFPALPASPIPPRPPLTPPPPGAPRAAGAVFTGNTNRSHIARLKPGGEVLLARAPHEQQGVVFTDSTNRRHIPRLNPGGEELLAAGALTFESTQKSARLNPGGEVLLAAGALGSPQLLLLSGLGPTEKLEAEGNRTPRAAGVVFTDSTNRCHIPWLNPFPAPPAPMVPLLPPVHRPFHSPGTPRAAGVVFTDSTNRRHIARLNPGGEVLLAAGALGSPQLLLLSGLGPREKLDPLGVPVVAEVPGVGVNVTDVPINGINVLSPRPVEESSLQVSEGVAVAAERAGFPGGAGGGGGARHGCDVTDVPINGINVLSPRPVEESSLQEGWIPHSSSALILVFVAPCVRALSPLSSSSPIFLSLSGPSLHPFVAFVAVTPEGNIIEGASGSNHTLSWPGAGELNTAPPINRTGETEAMIEAMLPYIPGFIQDALNQAGFILHKVYLPASRGSLTLASLNASDNPIVRYNYFSAPQDVATCVRGAQILTKIVTSNAMAPFRYDTPPVALFLLDPSAALITPGNFRGASPALPDVSNFTASAQWCKDTVTVIWHFHGGCHRGVCVDSSYRVNGVQALRVVDGSTFLTSPGTNPMATCLMLGRFIGLNLLEERGFNISAA
ncbi:unnamed protein product [Closterium sp. NIES-65]|nr:unnamed protein product [Closterium sp. NIES-65]